MNEGDGLPSYCAQLPLSPRSKLKTNLKNSERSLKTPKKRGSTSHQDPTRVTMPILVDAHVFPGPAHMLGSVFFQPNKAEHLQPASQTHFLENECPMLVTHIFGRILPRAKHGTHIGAVAKTNQESVQFSVGVERYFG